jgi:hypothetical protein
MNSRVRRCHPERYSVPLDAAKALLAPNHTVPACGADSVWASVERVTHQRHAEAVHAAVLEELAAGIILIFRANETLDAHVGVERRAPSTHAKSAGGGAVDRAVSPNLDLDKAKELSIRV